MKKTDYNLSELRIKKHTIIAKIIEVPLKKRNSGLILQPDDKTKELYFQDFVDHPYQAEAILIGDGITELFSKGIVKGDILYLSDMPNKNDTVNLNGETYFKIYATNIVAVRSIKNLAN